ncbi:MAG: tryptophan 2,3-dioxygenase [Halobacteriovoraceae bacterium]|nr:tryptophan 2,3-dioxygenase [Halobacteriovoraceae bacterium]|tara:strand:- start:739 stop:1824 length:1086 start_codon:yes stop_codon:yes gene_type:complete
MKYEPIYYSEYLKLEDILGAQTLKSLEHGAEAHDETLFIIIHQTYELWFKQILHEFNSIYDLFNETKVKPRNLGTINHRLGRIIEIQKVLNQQLNIIETMTPLDFMEFRDYLVPASGFQSIQFRQIELKMGLRQKYRLQADKAFFNSRLEQKDKDLLIKMEEEPTFLELLDAWLARMPFAEMKGFNFWQEYQNIVNQMLDRDEEIIRSNQTLSDKEKEFELRNLNGTRMSFQILFDEKKYNELRSEGIVKLSREAKLSAIFIKLYRDEPILQIPNRLLELLIDMDEMFTTWRYRHAIMAHRMLGTKIGTGGSSGHEYLKKSTENNRVFSDLFNLATYLIPIKNLPELPAEISSSLGFNFES